VVEKLELLSGLRSKTPAAVEDSIQTSAEKSAERPCEELEE
jgi:hypothetical protein